MNKTESIFSEKVSLHGKWVGVMNFSRDDRGIIVTKFRTRCFKKHEIHEFILCSENTNANQPIDNVSYLGFGEFIQGGVVEIGDMLYLGNSPYGTVLGFDETHFPNHYNILIKTKKLQTGYEIGINIEDKFSIKFNNENKK